MIKKDLISRRGVLLAPLVAAFLPLLTSYVSSKEMPKRKIILDVDTGVDDAAAILIANISTKIDLLGITTVSGNTSLYNATRNTQFIKNKFDIKAPIIKGADKPINGILVDDKKFHGHDGLGDAYNMDDVDLSAVEADAPDFIAKNVLSNPGEITIVSVGPSTNLALALKRYPKIKKDVHSVVMMGGAAGLNGDMGNVSPVAEFNVFTDPEAADIILGGDWPVTMVGLDVTYSAPTNDAFFNKLIDVGGEAGKFITNVNQYYISSYEEERGVRASNQHDAMALMYLLHPEIFTVVRGKLKVSTESIFSRGQTIFCPENHGFATKPGWIERPVQNVCATVNKQAFLNLFTQTISNYNNT